MGGTTEVDTSTAAMDALVAMLEQAAADEEMAFTRFGYEDAAQAVDALLRERDRLREALRKASDELYGAATGLDHPAAQALVEGWARQARQSADSVTGKE